MLARVGWNRSPSTPLVELEHGPAALERSQADPQNVKHGASSSTPGRILSSSETMCTCQIYSYAPTVETIKCPSLIRKHRMYAVEHYSAVNRNEEFTHATL